MDLEIKLQSSSVIIGDIYFGSAALLQSSDTKRCVSMSEAQGWPSATYINPVQRRFENFSNLNFFLFDFYVAAVILF